MQRPRDGQGQAAAPDPLEADSGIALGQPAA
jgi:hypothetical protein